jgi:hypothetical protein
MFSGFSNSQGGAEASSGVRRQTRYLAFSAWSFLSIGLLFLLVIASAWVYLGYEIEGQTDPEQLFGRFEAIPSHYYALAAVACLLALGLGLGLVTWFNNRKAERLGLARWNAAATKMVQEAAVPLLGGGLLLAVLVFRYGLFGLVAPLSLLFYGLALTRASWFSLRELRSLGYVQIGLGLVSCLFPRETLLFWGLGLGLAHVLFGLWMAVREQRAMA